MASKQPDAVDRFLYKAYDDIQKIDFNAQQGTERFSEYLKRRRATVKLFRRRLIRLIRKREKAAVEQGMCNLCPLKRDEP